MMSGNIFRRINWIFNTSGSINKADRLKKQTLAHEQKQKEHKEKLGIDWKEQQSK